MLRHKAKSSSHILPWILVQGPKFHNWPFTKTSAKHCRNGSTDGDVKRSGIKWDRAVLLRIMAEIKEAMPDFTYLMAEVVREVIKNSKV
jgi:hypothetical protein